MSLLVVLCVVNQIIQLTICSIKYLLHLILDRRLLSSV